MVRSDCTFMGDFSRLRGILCRVQLPLFWGSYKLEAETEQVGYLISFAMTY